MRKILLAVAGYILVSALSGVWFDSMDARYGVSPPATRSWSTTTILAATWPINMPLALYFIADGSGGGRWTLGRAQQVSA